MSKKRVLYLTVVVAAVIGWFSLSRPSSHERINGAQAKELVAAGARLVDVRTPAEYATKHIDGAVNIPVQVPSYDR